MLNSDSPRNSNNRVPFGALSDVSYEELFKNNEKKNYLSCSSTNKIYKLFKISEINVNIWKANDFSLEIQRMKRKSEGRLLAMYMKLLIHSEEFLHYNPEIHVVDGRLIDGTGVQSPDLVQLGGSLEKFKQFRDWAKASADIVDDVKQIPSKLAGKPKDVSYGERTDSQGIFS